MSLLPLILRDMELALQTFSAPLRTGLLRPLSQIDSALSSIKSDDKEFAVKLDVNHFKPEELKVKLENNFVVVEGKHEEKSDELGFISRHFTRRYKLPDDVLQDSLASNLSSDGVLTLQAAKKPQETSAVREINIVKTNQPDAKEESQKEEKSKESSFILK